MLCVFKTIDFRITSLYCPSAIEDPKTIDKIIRHLKLNFQAERPPPCHVAHQELLMAAEEQGENF